MRAQARKIVRHAGKQLKCDYYGLIGLCDLSISLFVNAVNDGTNAKMRNALRVLLCEMLLIEQVQPETGFAGITNES